VKIKRKTNTKTDFTLADLYRHRGLRKGLVDALRKKGIDDERILDAIMAIPRHQFLDKAFADWAYKDVPFPIGHEQTISQPFTVAFQTKLLEVKPKDKILEIGTGSGYQACVLVEMGAKVYTIERVEALFHKTNKLLQELGYGMIRTFLKDGFEGLPRFAPFDKILVTCGATDIPQTLKDQVRIGGYMVIPVGSGEAQEMIRLTRLSETEFQKETFGMFRFVPFLKGLEKLR